MVEHNLQRQTSLLKMLIGLFNIVKSHPIATKEKKPKTTQDDELFFDNASREVLIEYYKNLGRGPI